MCPGSDSLTSECRSMNLNFLGAPLNLKVINFGVIFVFLEDEDVMLTYTKNLH